MFFPLHRLNFSTPFSSLKTIEEFADTAFNNASQLSEFEAIKRVSSIVGRAITAILGHGLTRSANTRGLLSANPAFLQTCSDILWFLRWDFWFENLCSSQLNSACNVYEAGKTSSSASNSYSATAFLPHSNSLSSQSTSYRFCKSDLWQNIQACQWCLIFHCILRIWPQEILKNRFLYQLGTTTSRSEMMQSLQSWK